MRILLVVCAVMLLPVTAARATVIFDNGLSAADLTEGNLAYSDLSVTGSMSGPHQRLAEDFDFAGPRAVSGVTFYGSYYPNNGPATDQFELRFFSDDGSGRPGAAFGLPIPLSLLNRTNTGLDVSELGAGPPLDIYHYDAAFAEVEFAAGTTYWFSVLNNTLADADDFVLISNVDGGNRAQSQDDGATWINLDESLAFTLTGRAVPEPGTAVLVGLTLVACGIQRRSARRHGCVR